MNHRESWAEERVAPSREAAAQLDAEIEVKTAERPIGNPKSTVSSMTMGAPSAAGTPNRRVIAHTSLASSVPSKEVLVVVSKVKDFIRVKSEMNTSQSAMEILSDFVRAHCEEAIQRAREEGRKTVLDRDFIWKS
jgi:hypothetical protein